MLNKEQMEALDSFKASLILAEPEKHLSLPLKSLWYDAKGNWDKAHDFVDQLPGADAAWVHAYLHRKEGDIWNADYWYSKAKKSRPNTSLEEEWESLLRYFIKYPAL
jgi:hypothetical protein